MAEATKVGIIACSGEEIAAGTISRLATRRVLELLRPQSTVTLCLPLFLAGEEQERRFARQHPTITVDGCDKLCAKRGTEQYSGQVATSLVVTDILGSHVQNVIARPARLTRRMSRPSGRWPSGSRPKWMPCQTASQSAAATAPPDASCGCACGSRPVEGNSTDQRPDRHVPALPLIFDHLHKQGVTAGNGSTDRLLEMVRIYHAIEPDEEHLYREALSEAYAEYCRNRRSRSWKSNSSMLEYAKLPLWKQCYLAKQPNAERRCQPLRTTLGGRIPLAASSPESARTPMLAIDGHWPFGRMTNNNRQETCRETADASPVCSAGQGREGHGPPDATVCRGRTLPTRTAMRVRIDRHDRCRYVDCLTPPGNS